MNVYFFVVRVVYYRFYVIVMRYKGNVKFKYIFGFVGKGFIYDIGGLLLKFIDSMFIMRCDMGGVVIMIGVMCFVVKMKFKKNVICVVVVCENLIGFNVYRFGDILIVMNGKIIEVINIDVEGRLILVDVLIYIVRKEKVNEVIDVVILIGVIMVVFGEDVIGVFINDEKMVRKVIDVFENWNEYFW